MKQLPKPALLAMLSSLVMFVVAMAWGAAYAFPEPDAASVQAGSVALHARLSGWLMFAAVVLFTAAALIVAWRTLFPQRRKQDRSPSE